MTGTGDAVPSVRPLAIAHRGGNDLARADRALQIGANYLEADIHLHRGRLEVRHTKTMGRIPVLWDRWRLEPGWTRRLELAELVEHLEAAGRPAQLLLDLKRGQLPLVRAVEREMSLRTGEAPYAVCSRTWSLVDPFVEVAHVSAFHSVGSLDQLRAIGAHLDRMGRRGKLSVDREILDDTGAATVRRMAEVVFAWHVGTQSHVRQVRAWGFDGMTVDSELLLRWLVREQTRTLASAERGDADRP